MCGAFQGEGGGSQLPLVGLDLGLDEVLDVAGASLNQAGEQTRVHRIIRTRYVSTVVIEVLSGPLERRPTVRCETSTLTLTPHTEPEAGDRPCMSGSV